MTILCQHFVFTKLSKNRAFFTIVREVKQSDGIAQLPQNGSEQNRIERSNLHKWNKTKSVVNVVNSHTVLNAYTNKSSLTFNPLSVSYFLQAAAGRD